MLGREWAFARLRSGARTYQVELAPSDFELSGPLNPGQTFEAQWIRLESGAEAWRCIADPPKFASREQVPDWVAHYTVRYELNSFSRRQPGKATPERKRR